ncbi:MAG: PilZ domain-containing protein [Bacillota bacterium]
MSWFKRNPTVTEGPGAAVDLRSLAGTAGRLLFAHGLGVQRMVESPCQVLRVDRSEILVEPTGGGARPGAEQAVILEVLHEVALVQCFTTVLRTNQGGSIALRVPARPHVVRRRRNPRVDVYIGVTLRTPDRPIEETPAQLTNLSLDGAACVLAEPLAPGTEISINLAPLGLTPPQLAATVVRCVPTPTHLWVVGLRFQEVHPAQMAYLARYLEASVQPGGPGESSES